MPASVRRVAVTGAGGNLGQKLIAWLLSRDWCEGIVGFDREKAGSRLPEDPRLTTITADLTDRRGAWRAGLARTDGLVHLAAQNPYPDASWADGVASIDMTLNLIEAAAALGQKRFVFASSNHVMGGYKETSLATIAGALTPDLDPWPGTQRPGPDGPVAPAAYAVAKLTGERALAARADAAGLTAVSLRIGWCQPGENDPATISAAGVPGADENAADPASLRDLRWFRQMWLSNRDFCGIVEAALRADAADWPTAAVVVNAMSGNTGAPWNLDAARSLLGFQPVDDVWTTLALPPPVPG